MMFRRFALVAMMGLVLTTVAQADPITVKTGTVVTSTGGATTALDVNAITGDASLGYTFNNNTSTTTPGGGGNIISVGSNLLTNYDFRTGGATPATYNGTPIVAVFALQGTSTAGSSALFTLQSGRVAFFSIASLSSYNQFNPTTWGATTADGKTLLTPIAVWDVKPQGTVPGTLQVGDQTHDTGINGSGGPGIFDGKFFNPGSTAPNDVLQQITINTQNTNNTAGLFAFKEGSSLASLEGDNFFNVTGNTPIVPNGFHLTDEGVITLTTESVSQFPNSTFISGGNGTPGFDALNTLASALGGLGSFASDFGSGTAAEFNPTTNGPDIDTTIGTTSSPFVEFLPNTTTTTIPEPATMLLWGGLLAGLGCYRRLRRRPA